MRKNNNVVSDQVPHKPRCTSTEDGQRLESLNLGHRRIAKYPLCSENKKALISFTVTVHLVCAFVSSYVKYLFSHEVSQIK